MVDTKLLVIDPSKPVRKAVSLLARPYFSTVLEAGSLAEASDALSAGVDLVCTETELPDGKGQDVLDRVRNADTVVLALTAEDDVSAAIELMRQGAFSVLTKPLTSKDFSDTVERATKQHMILAENQAAQELQRRYSEDLENQVREKTRFISSLLEFSNQLNALDTISEAVELLARTFRELVGCQRISILLKTIETGQFAVVKAMGLPQDVLKRPIDLSQSPVVKRVAGGEIVYVDDVEGSMMSQGRGSGNAFLSVPLRSKNGSTVEVFGVINLTDRIGNQAFTETERKLVQSIVEAASVACSNLRNKQTLEKSYFDTVGALALALEAKDPYTHGHSQRVTSMCMIVADVMGFSNEDMDQIMFAGMLHDVGKIGIPESILLKRERLTNKEFERIREHPVIGARMVSHISFLERAADIIRHHHERWDGKGYPDGLRGQEISIPARIMAIADSYDAMTTDRSYRKRLNHYQVNDELMKGRGTQFEPECLDVFIRHVAESRSIPDHS
jgi:putative nucleotidyltransferase with HDIG domain